MDGNSLFNKMRTLSTRFKEKTVIYRIFMAILYKNKSDKSIDCFVIDQNKVYAKYPIIETTKLANYIRIQLLKTIKCFVID